MSSDSDSIKVFDFYSTTPGAHLVVLAQIHGNEPCGEFAMKKVIAEIESRRIKLDSGRVTFIPQCNPLSVSKKKRFIDANLNRVFTAHRKPCNYEERIANTLVRIIGKPTLMLDLHSYPSEDKNAVPFALKEFSNAFSDKLMRRLPIRFLLSGWQDLQIKYHRPKVFSTIAQTTKLGVPGIGLECGEHSAQHSKQTAYEAIRMSMDALKISNYSKHAPQKQRTINLHFDKLYLYPQEGGAFSRKWKDFAKVKKGDIIAKTKGRENIVSPMEGRIILPNYNAQPGEEWFYISREI